MSLIVEKLNRYYNNHFLSLYDYIIHIEYRFKNDYNRQLHIQQQILSDPAFHQQLLAYYIGFEDPNNLLLPSSCGCINQQLDTHQHLSFSEIMNKIIVFLLQNPDKHSNNVLTLGYTFDEKTHQPNQQQNHNHYFFNNTSFWQHLHHLIGDVLFLHLLLHSSLFHSLNSSQTNDCFVQVSGPALHFNDSLYTKKRKTHKSTTASVSHYDYDDQLKHLHYIQNMRSPTSLGRNKNHLLNQLYLYNERFDHEHITNQTCVFGAVVIFHHNYKSFQRQFPSVTDIFHSSSPNPTLSQPHNELFPKRLHNVIPIIRELIQNYHAINFHSLLCQISPRQTRYVGKDSFHVLFVHELSVFHYIRRVLDQLLTKNMISKRNRKVLYHFIYMFICYSMKNTLTISNIMRGIAVYDFTWLKNDHHQTHNKKKHDYHVPPQDLKLQTELVESFLFFVMKDIVIDLLADSFYITTIDQYKGRTVYILKQSWLQLFHSVVTHHHCYGMFEPAPKENTLFSIPSFFHFKSNNSIRIVNNLSKINNPFFQDYQLIYNYLYARYSQDIQSDPFYCSSITKLTTRLKELFRHYPDQELYFLTLDISKCYDSMKSTIVDDLLKELFASSADYSTCSYQKVYSSFHKKRTMFSLNTISPLSSLFEYHNILLNPSLYCHTLTPSSFNYYHSLINDLFYNSLYYLYNKPFRRTQGIPQGSIFSVILCYYYYHRFERDYLSPFFPSHCQDTFIFRYIDDYLCISTSKESILQLKHIFVDQSNPYNLIVNPNKIQSNIPEFLSIPSSTLPYLHYCGLLIDPQTHQLFRDYSKYTNCKSTHLFHFPYNKVLAGRPSFTNYCSFLNSSYYTLLDPSIQSYDSIYINLYGLFYMLHLRYLSFHHMARLVHRSSSFNGKAELSYLQHLYRYLYCKLKNRISHSFLSYNDFLYIASKSLLFLLKRKHYHVLLSDFYNQYQLFYKRIKKKVHHRLVIHYKHDSLLPLYTIVF